MGAIQSVLLNFFGIVGAVCAVAVVNFSIRFKPTMNAERQMIIKSLNSKEARLFMYAKSIRVAKHESLSTQSLEDAKRYYRDLKHTAKLHSHVWKLYSCSISNAPDGTEELALGFQGRSSFFHHIGKYEECLHDVERALAITKSNALKVKLLYRKAECLTYLGSSENKNTLEKAKFWLKKIKEGKVKAELDSLFFVTEDVMKDIVSSGKTIVKKAEKNPGIWDALELKEAENTCKTISVKYDEENGRHLVAARNIKPGEIICVEKPYVMTSNTEFTPYAYCCHCLKVSWTSIPCDVCGWAFFCSDKCKEEAWEQYHDMECFVMPKIRHTAESELWRQLVIRTVILAVREAGSISKLRAELTQVDKCTDKRTRGFSKNGKFQGDKFTSLYSLSHKMSPNLAKIHTRDAIRILLCFVKHSTLFGDESKFKVIADLQNDEDVLFVGSLILRLFGIFSVNYQEIFENNLLCEMEHDPVKCFDIRCCYRGTTVSPLLSLMNHSCDPNAAIMFTDAKKMIVYSLKPIKKNAQILYSYAGCGTFYQKSKKDRQTMTKKAYNFTCTCQACQNDWPLLITLNPDNEVALSNISSFDKTTPEILQRIQELIALTKQKKIRLDEQTVKELGNVIKVATANYSQPSYTVCSLINALMTVYHKLYLTRVHVTSKCKNW